MKDKIKMATYTKEEITANRAKLIEALRSDKYKQSGYRLATLNNDGNVSYCALGVVCNESGVGDWFVTHETDFESWVSLDDFMVDTPLDEYTLGFSDKIHSDSPVRVFTSDEELSKDALLKSVSEMYGFNSTGEVEKSTAFMEAILKSDSEVAKFVKEKAARALFLDTKVISLITLNDGIHMPFPLIADFIEEFGEYFTREDD